METDLIDCRWIWREGVALGAVLALLLRFVAMKTWQLWLHDRTLAPQAVRPNIRRDTRMLSGLLLVGLSTLSACDSLPTRGYVIPPGGLILTENRELIARVCHNALAIGCYDPPTRTIHRRARSTARRTISQPVGMSSCIMPDWHMRSFDDAENSL